MSSEEAEAFEADPWHPTILLMPGWDEQAKRSDWIVPELDTYLPMIREHLKKGIEHQ